MTFATSEINIDVNHPTIGAYGLCSKQAGFLELAAVIAKLKEHNIPSELHPAPIGNGTALKRAMEDASAGDKTLRVDSTGKALKVVYSIVRTNKERLDLEQDGNTGKGVADASVSARVEANGVGGLSLVIKPDDHEMSAYIRERFDYHREHYKCSEDLSQWLSQRVFKNHLINATPRPGSAGGFYFIPKGDGLDLLKKISTALEELSTSDSRKLYNGVKLYFIPMLTGTEDVLDAIVDSLIDDAEKIMEDLEEALDPAKELGCRALGSKAKQADQLRKKIETFAKSMTIALPDIETRLNDLKSRIIMAEIAATGV